MPSATTTVTISLTLSKAAKGSGGDKYLTTFSNAEDTKRERAIYVPQIHSRLTPTKTSEPSLSARITNVKPTCDEWLYFKLFKQAKGSGDDRYTPTSDSWVGDIYLPKEFRTSNKEVYMTFNRELS